MARTPQSRPSVSRDERRAAALAPDAFATRDVNERDRLRRQRAEVRAGSTIERAGVVRREPHPGGGADGDSDRPGRAGAVIGLLFLIAAVTAVLGALAFAVLAGDAGDQIARPVATRTTSSPAETPTRTPLRGLTGGSAVTPSASASPTPSATATAAQAPPATPSPAPQPPTPAPTPPPPRFTATVEVCREVVNGACQGAVRSVNPSDEWVVLLATLDAASRGDVIGFDVSGAETFRVGSVTLQSGGGGIAYVELYTRDLERGSYTVTLTRNGEAVATTRFERKGGRD